MADHHHKHHGTGPPMVPAIRPAHATPAMRPLMGYQPVGSPGAPYGTFNTGNMPRFPTAGRGHAMFPPPAASDGPSAPPASMFDSIPGYEGTVAGGGGGFLPPPMPAVPVSPPEPAPEMPHWNIPPITEEAAREALILYASSKCCYSSAPAKDGVITNTEAFNTYRYRLETFTESRSTEWSHEPYIGQPVDAYTRPPPGPWDISVQTPNFFLNAKDTIKVPYTSSVKGCHSCVSMGRKPCKVCAGAGNRLCGPCNGSGFRVEGGQCFTCSGRGRQKCYHCNGQGSRQCHICQGKGQLLVYINLTINWTNNSDDYVVEQLSGLQVANLSEVSGNELYRDSQYLVCPVKGFPDPSVEQASQRLVSEHQGRFSNTSRILQQRHTIELIPITKVTYLWKGKSNIYYVYGNELKVNADNYPATCCCSVM